MREHRSNQKNIAVLAMDGLYIIDAKREQTAKLDPINHEGATLATLLLAAKEHECKQLWVHDSWARIAGMWWPTVAGTFVHTASGWTVNPDPAERSYRYHAVYQGGGMYYACDVLLPWLDSSRTSWKKAEDGETLTEMIRAYDHALQFDFMATPGGTGTALMRALHPEEGHHIPLEAPHLPFVARTNVILEPAWINATVAPEHYTYLHMFDKHGAWLAACNGLWLGYGDVVHARRSEELTAMWLGGDSPMRHSPGYWCVSGIQGFEGQHLHRVAPSLEMLIDPGYFHGRHPAGSLWLMTPTMQALREDGYVPEIIEAYFWPEAHQTLTPWYKRIRDARAELMAPDNYLSPAGRRLALKCLKETYTQSLGYLAPKTWSREEGHPLVRPDWRHAIIAEGEARLWRQAMKAARNGVLIGAIDYDAWVILSNEAEPAAVAAQAGIKIGDGVGEWEVKCALMAAPFATYWNYAHTDDARLRGRAHSDLMEAIYGAERRNREVPF